MYLKSIILILLLVLIGCTPEAPRNNPLDPALNLSNSGATITGKVYSFYQPLRPLKNVMVRLSPSDRMVMTDDQGSFAFQSLNPAQYRLTAQRENYMPDTVWVSIESNRDEKDVALHLNALPQIRRMEYYSEHIDRWYLGEVYHAIFTVVVSDSDGVADIDSITFTNPAFNLTKPFNSTSRADSFVIDIENFELPDANLQHLIENESFVHLKDNADGRVTKGPFYLRRIIDDAPFGLTPADLDTVSASPNFGWQPIGLPFSFCFLVQVYRIDAGLTILIHTSPAVPSNQFNYEYPDSLPGGTYIWTVAVRDNLKNFSRSKEASFIVR